MTFWDRCPADVIHTVIHYASCYTTSWDPPLSQHVATAARLRILADSSFAAAPIYTGGGPASDWLTTPNVTTPCLPDYLRRRYFIATSNKVDWIRAAAEHSNIMDRLVAVPERLFICAVLREADHHLTAIQATVAASWRQLPETELARRIDNCLVVTKNYSSSAAIIHHCWRVHELANSDPFIARISSNELFENS